MSPPGRTWRCWARTPEAGAAVAVVPSPRAAAASATDKARPQPAQRFSMPTPALRHLYEVCRTGVVIRLNQSVQLKMFPFCSNCVKTAGMADPPSDVDRELARDIAYALARSPFKTKGQSIETLRLVADGVVAHLRRSGWRAELGPPVAAHGPTRPPETRG